MFLHIEKKRKEKTALSDYRGGHMTYGELCEFSEEFYSYIQHRTVLFILCEQTVEAAAGAVGCLSGKVVPLLLDAHMDQTLLQSLMDIYKPEYIWAPASVCSQEQVFVYGSYVLTKTVYGAYPVYEDLSMLLTTSGSTGSPKLVRHSYRNVEENGKNVATFFELSGDERAMAILPMHYTMGLSVVFSHLYAGAEVLLNGESMASKGFWEYWSASGATSFTGVPYSFEVLKKLRFTSMKLPGLTLLTQGGGRMPKELQMEFIEYIEKIGGSFIATYGQTEGTARMAYLPKEFARSKCGSIGKAIPNGRLYVQDEEGNQIFKPHIEGEMFYEGPNVTLGYAGCREDLMKGDERGGVLPTGDIAYFDEEGFFYICGRKKRFLKLFGHRVSLDECERLIQQKFGISCACTGTDQLLIVYVESDRQTEEIRSFLLETMKLYGHALEVRGIPEIPRNPAGKILYHALGVE